MSSSTSTALPSSSSFFYYDDLRASIPEEAFVRRPESAIVASNIPTTTEEAETETDATRTTIRWMSVACAWGFSVRLPENGFLVMDFLLSSAKGAMMAARDFNTGNAAIVPQLGSTEQRQCNIKLNLDFFDTYQDAREGALIVQKYVAPRQTRRKYAAVIGALRSAVSIPMAVLNRVHEIPQISHSSTSTVLNDRSTYSLFGRVIPSTDGDARAAIQYLQQRLRTTHLGILYVSEEYSTDYQRSLLQASLRAGITVKSFAVRYQGGTDGTREEWLDRLTVVVDRLIETGYRHFIGVVFAEHLGDLIDIGAKKGLFGPERFWMFPDTITRDTILDLKYPQDSPQAQALQGLALLSTGESLIIGTYQRFLQQYDSLRDDQDFLNYFQSKSPVSELVHFHANYSFGIPDHYALLAYDAVMSLGLAACQSPPQEFITGPQIFDQFLRSKFDGASGWVEIDPSTASRNFTTVTYILRNVLTTTNTTTQAAGETNDGMARIDVITAALYASPTNTTATRTNNTQGRAPADWLDVDGGFIFSDGTKEPPLALPELAQQDTYEYSVALYAFFVALGVILMLSSLGFAMWTWHCRKDNRVVKASQPGFLLVICTGTFLVAFSMVMRGAANPPHSLAWADFGCQAQHWFFAIGFSLAFSALFAKTWRVVRIMGEHVQRFHRVVVKPTDVMIPVFIFVVGNLIILTVWQIMDPLHFVRHPDTEGSVDRFGRYTETIAECSSEHGWSNYFLGAVLFWNGCMIVAANITAYRARHIRMEFSESTYIALAMGIILQALILALPVFVVETTPVVSFVASQLLVAIADSSILFLLFVPKISASRQWAKMKHEKAEKKKLRASQALAAASSTGVASVDSFMVPQNGSGEYSTARSASPDASSSVPPVVGQQPSLLSTHSIIRSSRVECDYDDDDDRGLLIISVRGFDLNSVDCREEPVACRTLLRSNTQRAIQTGTSTTATQQQQSQRRLPKGRGRWGVRSAPDLFANLGHSSQSGPSGLVSIGNFRVGCLSNVRENDDDDDGENTDCGCDAAADPISLSYEATAADHGCKSSNPRSSSCMVSARVSRDQCSSGWLDEEEQVFELLPPPAAVSPPPASSSGEEGSYYNTIAGEGGGGKRQMRGNAQNLNAAFNFSSAQQFSVGENGEENTHDTIDEDNTINNDTEVEVDPFSSFDAAVAMDQLNYDGDKRAVATAADYLLPPPSCLERSAPNSFATRVPSDRHNGFFDEELQVYSDP